MPHSIILLNQLVDELIADATEGPLVDLKTAFNQLDSEMPYQKPARQQAAHDAMDATQAWLEANNPQPTALKTDIDAVLNGS